MRSTHPFAPAGFLLLCASLAGAQSVPPDLALEVVTDAVVAPIGVRAPNDGSGRLFILSQAGTIRIVKDGVLLPAPFLTVPVTYPGSGGTSGLLGLAFHPNYGHVGAPHNDEFYVVSMRPPGCTPAGTCLGSGPDEVLERYTVSEDPDEANASGTVVMRLADNSPPSYHNGGDIHFGPDGYLYMSSGDGGQESGTHWLAECLWKKPNDTTSTSCGSSAATPQYFLRGKMLRIDVDTRGATATMMTPATRAAPPTPAVAHPAAICVEAAS
jgi:glucose/arabinose dehydrogenase